MNQLVTTGIILSRVDYGEADRILTLLTPDQGKLRLLARGVRRVKSKLAGGIELFSVSHITYIPGRQGGMGTLVSTRLSVHYAHIVEDIERTMLGYDIIKQLNRQTEDEPEAAYFQLLQAGFETLNEGVSLAIIRLWFAAQLLRLHGHAPNLHTDDTGQPLDPAATYNFSFEHMAFAPAGRHEGRFSARHIKFLRLCFGDYSAATLAHVAGAEALTAACGPIVQGLAAHV